VFFMFFVLFVVSCFIKVRPQGAKFMHMGRARWVRWLLPQVFMVWGWVPGLKVVLKRKAPLCRRGIAERGLEGLGEGDISSASKKH